MVNRETMWHEDIKAKRKQNPNYTANLPMTLEVRYINANGKECYEAYTFKRYESIGDSILQYLMDKIEEKTKIPILQGYHQVDDLE